MNVCVCRYVYISLDISQFSCQLQRCNGQLKYRTIVPMSGGKDRGLFLAGELPQNHNPLRLASTPRSVHPRISSAQVSPGAKRHWSRQKTTRWPHPRRWLQTLCGRATIPADSVCSSEVHDSGLHDYNYISVTLDYHFHWRIWYHFVTENIANFFSFNDEGESVVMTSGPCLSEKIQSFLFSSTAGSN